MNAMNAMKAKAPSIDIGINAAECEKSAWMLRSLLEC
jgi:hypothetical protein